MEMRSMEMNVWQYVIKKHIEAIQKWERIEHRGMDVTDEMQQVSVLMAEINTKAWEAVKILDGIEEKRKFHMVNNIQTQMDERYRQLENRRMLEG